MEKIVNVYPYGSNKPYYNFGNCSVSQQTKISREKGFKSCLVLCYHRISKTKIEIVKFLNHEVNDIK